MEIEFDFMHFICKELLPKDQKLQESWFPKNRKIHNLQDFKLKRFIGLNSKWMQSLSKYNCIYQRVVEYVGTEVLENKNAAWNRHQIQKGPNKNQEKNVLFVWYPLRERIV